VKLTITHNFAQVQRELARLHKDIAGPATVRAVNRTMEQAKTEMSRRIRREYVISASTVRDSLLIRRASFKGGQYRIEAELSSISKRGKRSLNLIHFGARETPKGVSVKVRRDGRRRTINGAFIANQGRTVFIREGKKRLPIKAVQTIGVPQMFNARKVKDVVVNTLRTKFPEVWEREVRFYTAKFNARAGR
jgi:hypothetical protein